MLHLKSSFTLYIVEFIQLYQIIIYHLDLAIILFTIIIRIVLLPLSIKQTKSTAKMGAIQPEMKKVQEKYKKDPQKSQQEVMKLYKENGVNPMGGCLPMLIQMPILFALFAVFQNLNLQGAGFLWMTDLTKPDPIIYYQYYLLLQHIFHQNLCNHQVAVLNLNKLQQ